MYSREIEREPKSFVHNGKPVFGTFSGHPSKMDIRGVKRPYGVIPLPTFITNLRIKSQVSFHFNFGDYIGYVYFLDAKIVGFAEVAFWNKTNRQKCVYRTLMGPRKRFVPHDLEAASTSCFKKRKYIRISWDRKHERLTLVFNIHDNSLHPHTVAAINASLAAPSCAEITTLTPAPTSRRVSALFSMMSPIKGSLNLFPKNKEPKLMHDTEGYSLWSITRSYLRFRAHGEFVLGLGEVNGKPLSFRITATSQEAVNPSKYNSNYLFYDGTVTPLPPVVITHHYGIMNQWVIQDTENMVDLTFTPYSDNHDKKSVFVLRTDQHTIYGNFEGELRTTTGEKLSFKNLDGFSKKYLYRL